MFKRSLSPLIATILLIVVSVILITVILTWGSSFTKNNLNQTSFSQNKDFIGLITSRSISSQDILISNNHFSTDLNIVGYKVISSIDHYLYDYFENKIYYLDKPLIINPNSAQTLQIDCYPENSFFIDLITDQNTYVRIQILARSINDIDPFRCGLVGNWNFNDCSGNKLRDLSRFNNTGNFVGNPQWVVDPLNPSDCSLYFNGSNRVTINNHINQNKFEQKWSVIAWVNIDDSNDQLLLSGINRGLYLNYGTTRRLLLYLNSVDHDYYRYSNATGLIANLGWKQVAFIFRNEDALREVYVDTLNVSGTGPNKTSTPLGISSSLSIGLSTVGNIDNLRIYDRVISVYEIQELYNIDKK